MGLSRREFVRGIGAATALVALDSVIAPGAHAYPLGLRPGLQLWSVKDALEADQAGTLQRLGAMGYREVELYELPRAPASFKKQCADAGLTIVGSHFYLHSLSDKKTIDAALELGMHYIVVVFPTLRSLSTRDISNATVQELMPFYEKISGDDYKWNAQEFNRYGSDLKKVGLQLGYHNHAVDFTKFGNTNGFEILLGATDPNLVVFEMDCGHVIHAGSDPIQYLRRYPKRIQLLHLKDLKKGFEISNTIETEEMDTNAELGDGVIDWKQLFQVASKGSIRHYFVEHEGKMAHEPLEALARSLAFLRSLQGTN